MYDYFMKIIGLITHSAKSEYFDNNTHMCTGYREALILWVTCKHQNYNAKNNPNHAMMRKI